MTLRGLLAGVLAAELPQATAQPPATAVQLTVADWHAWKPSQVTFVGLMMMTAEPFSVRVSGQTVHEGKQLRANRHT